MSAMSGEWYCQWCKMWHTGQTNCEGQDSRERVMESTQ